MKFHNRERVSWTTNLSSFPFLLGRSRWKVEVEMEVEVEVEKICYD